MSSRKNVAIVGAAGSCGRQLAVQLLDREILSPDARLQLVAHHGGASEYETHGLRADLRDAFADTAPMIELIDQPEQLDADILVMLAGSTVPTDPTQNVDRIALARTNLRIFTAFAEELARRDGTPPLVIVQSNPVELGVEVFSRVIDRHLVVGAGAYSDSIRFRREIADSLGVRRSDVNAVMLGQHGDNLIPAWSQVAVDGISSDVLASWIAEQRDGRSLEQLPEEIVIHRSELLSIVAGRDVHGAFAHAAQLPPEIRAAVKPFLIHTTAGHTTEIVTAHSVADIIDTVVNGEPTVLPLQVMLENDYLGLTGVGGVPVRLGSQGWTEVVDLGLAEDEVAALRRAFDAVATVSAAVQAS
ncbi:Mdh Malate/lactate dehydrogenases [Acidimicrobiia bacterium]